MVYWVLLALIGFLSWHWHSTYRRRPEVLEIVVYPVKSCAGLRVSEAAVSDSGFMLDRWWAVMQLPNRIITQKEDPRLGRIKPRLALDQSGRPSSLTLAYPGFPPCKISTEEPAVTELISTSIFGAECFVYEQSALARDWFKQVLQTDYVLVRQVTPRQALLAKPDSSARLQADEHLSLADQLQFLVVTQASYKLLLTSLPEYKAATLSMDCFRPSIVLKNTQPFAEDSWTQFSINGVHFKVVDRCERCAVTTIDPTTLEFDRYREPVKTLSKINGDGKLGYFGIVVNRVNNGSIAVGNKLSF
jgi:uncharacterized protein YcbX